MKMPEKAADIRRNISVFQHSARLQQLPVVWQELSEFENLETCAASKVWRRNGVTDCDNFRKESHWIFCADVKTYSGLLERMDDHETASAWLRHKPEADQLIPCSRQEDEREFTYVQGSKNGPEKWGEIHPEWAACKRGRLQSPIDLLNERVSVGTHLRKLKRNYKPTNATIKNRGHDIMLRWVGGAGTIQINNTEYVLKQCHWHAPSEHTFNGKRYALEVHMVHESTDEKVAVVGITYIIGRPDTFLTELMEHIGPIVHTDNEERSIGVLNPRSIKIGSRKYYRYIGSLTIPPCTEDVVWTIVQKVRTVSRQQLRLLRDAVKDDSNTNARPVQPIKNHSVHLYRPIDSEDN